MNLYKKTTKAGRWNRPAFSRYSIFILAVYQGGDALKTLEQVDEMACVQIAQFLADLGDALGGFPEHLLGKLHLLTVGIGGEALAHFPVEQPGEIAGT